MSKANKEDMLKLAEKYYRDEMTDAMIYEYIADMEKDENLKKEFRALAYMERRHAQFWKKFLKRRGVSVKEFKIGRWKKFSAKFMRKVLGPGITVSIFESGEMQAIEKYFKFYTSYEMDESERKELGTIILDEIEHEKLFSNEKKVLRVENVRDLVLGMNDGLVEILGAVTGLSAIYVTMPFIVGLSGLIVGVAGALSMAIGTYVSVRSQRQVNESIRRKMEIIFAISPTRAEEEIKGRLKDSGLPDEMIDDIARKMASKKDAAIKLVPTEDVNEKIAALYTGFAYILGVFFPVVPYFFAPTTYIALPISVFLAGAALAVVSAIISMMSGISARKKAVEMVILGLGAAFVSYMFGTLLNAVFGITA